MTLQYALDVEDDIVANVHGHDHALVVVNPQLRGIPELLEKKPKARRG
jgi:hypothetical protein